MSWTVVADYSMKETNQSILPDGSEFNNHAHVSGNIQQGYKFLKYRDRDAQLEIPVNNDSLTQFGGLRIQAFIRPNAMGERLNIVEGWMSFAFFVGTNGKLVASIYDGHSWIGIDSGNATVNAGEWNRVLFEYDGVSIAFLQLNGNNTGTRYDMPVLFQQPQSVISIGHWPRGDGRYTFLGDMGHIILERRNHEDLARDAGKRMFCNRQFTEEQLSAIREIQYLFSNLNPDQQSLAQEFVKNRSLAVRHLVNKLRSTNSRELVLFRQLGRTLQDAWCCQYNPKLAFATLSQYLKSMAGGAGTADRASFEYLMGELWEIYHTPILEGHPFDRIEELYNTVFPELIDFEVNFKKLITRVIS